MIKTVIIFLSLIITMAACQKDKEAACVAPAAKENILGDWTAFVLSDSTFKDKLQFKSDGSFTEKKGLLFSNYNSPNITWTSKQDSIHITAHFASGSPSTYKFTVLKNECEQIMLDLDEAEQVILRRSK